MDSRDTRVSPTECGPRGAPQRRPGRGRGGKAVVGKEVPGEGLGRAQGGEEDDGPSPPRRILLPSSHPFPTSPRAPPRPRVRDRVRDARPLRRQGGPTRSSAGQNQSQTCERTFGAVEEARRSPCTPGPGVLRPSPGPRSPGRPYPSSALPRPWLQFPRPRGFA